MGDRKIDQTLCVLGTPYKFHILKRQNIHNNVKKYIQHVRSLVETLHSKYEVLTHRWQMNIGPVT
jgi:hypothetical protein